MKSRTPRYKKDLGIKRDRYARAGIREYWIVDLVHDCFHVFRQPGPDGTYSEHSTPAPGEIVRPLAYDDVFIEVAHVLGLD